ncbi:MAG TPA: SDR family oxidoreductase [Vicinamibacteria bacterium]|nr:SDR family oxidoreductase [Vicinamibacteria bacterium]
MNVLVTGGAGFIGSHLAEALCARGHRVRILDDLSAGRLDNVRAFRRDVELLRGDCADPAAARRAVKGVEVVYHQAAVPSVARSVKEPLLSHRTNATATLVMLDAARQAGVRRFLYAGSSSVYGDSKALPKREDMPPRPLSPYGVGKLAGEHFVRIFHHLHGMETLTLRYFNVYGPRQNASSPYSGVISLFVTALLDGRPPVIHGDGRQSRDFTYVADAVDANLRALTAKGLEGQHVNIAGGRRVTLRDLLGVLAGELGVEARAKRGPARPGDIRHSQADISAARRLLGYRPRTDLRQGLRRTVEWYRSGSGAG